MNWHKYLLGILVVALFQCASSVDAAVISSTFNQEGQPKQFVGVSGRQVKVGTASFVAPPPGLTITAIRLRVHLNFAADTAPELIIAPENDPFAAAGISGLLGIQSFNSPAVQEVQSPWVSVSPIKSSEILNLLAFSSNVDVWLRSTSVFDFNTPAKTSGLDFSSGLPVPFEIIYTATLQFQTVPEPSSLVGWVSFFLAGLFWRQRRKMGLKNL
jgi:hypothetical protein